ncbi:MAG: GDP-mannose 4,6-dehydratase [Chthoniobacterales bacterium]|nr:GDP-mannose 4,6-dehydratase [Chthoniobacterales bacterium]
MSKTALILGISGQDGAYLAHLLLEKGYSVVGTSRDHEIGSFLALHKLGIKDHVTLRSMSTSDFRSILTTIQEVQPDEIYNLAGQTSVGLSFSYPVETFESISVSTIHILECLRILKQKSRFYNAGSSEVFGNTPTPAHEQTPFRPRSPYATAKAAAHFAVLNYREAYGLFASTGLLFNHESPLRPARFVTQKIISTAVRIAQGSTEQLQLGNVSIHRDWGWAPEYVEAMWRILQQEVPDDFIIATGKMHSLEEFVRKTFSQLGLSYQDHVIIDKNLLRPSDIEKSVGDATKAAKLLDWKADITLDKIIAKMIEVQLQK